MNFIKFLFFLFLSTQVFSFDELYVCSTKGGGKITLIGELDPKRIKLESTYSGIPTSIWVDLTNTESSLSSDSFSRGAQTIVSIKSINNCHYLFEDSILAREIGDSESHDIIKKIHFSCGEEKYIVECALKSDGMKDKAYGFFPKEELY